MDSIGIALGIHSNSLKTYRIQLVTNSALALTEKRVALALITDGGGGAVARKNFGFVRKRQKPGGDGVDDLARVPARKISAANASGEERIAGDEQFERSEVQTD